MKDNYGHPAFTLVNKKTRKLLKHAKEKGQQVICIDYFHILTRIAFEFTCFLHLIRLIYVVIVPSSWFYIFMAKNLKKGLKSTNVVPGSSNYSQTLNHKQNSLLGASI